MNKTLSFFIACFLFLSVVILFATCSKEYSYEGGPTGGTAAGTAVYTLAGAGGDCKGGIVSGKYYVGNSLGSLNTVLLQVEVTTIGTYVLSTNLINGIKFSASGVFATQGVQTITLTGSGTPLTTGSFTFTPPVGLGCDFTVLVAEAPPAVASFTLAGSPNNCTSVQVNGKYVSGISLRGSNFVDITVNVTSIGAYSIHTDTLDGIRFSDSGTFTTTGNQTVTLRGSGTPDLPRNLTFTPLSGTSKCTFNVVVLNPDPLATYVIESGYGSPSPCIYTLSGTYTSNVLLDRADSVTIKVHVTAVGNFTIATNAVNGIVFSYTGTFTTTGPQFVILKGTGTPVSPGTYTFTPEIVGPHPLGGQFCAFTIVVQ
jgi:hypothetical protein